MRIKFIDSMMAKVFIFMSHLQVVSGGVLNTALNEKIETASIEKFVCAFL